MKNLQVLALVFLFAAFSGCTEIASTDVTGDDVSAPLTAGDIAPVEPVGEQLYVEHCRGCHEGKILKAPPRSLLGIMSASSVFTAINSGVMKTQASGLTTDQRKVLAEYLTGQKIDALAGPSPRRCVPGESVFDFDAPPDAEGWGVDKTNRHFYPDAVARITPEDIPKLHLKWVFRYPDAVRGRSQPATAGGGLFVGSQNGSVYSLDQKTGCVRWTYKTVAEVRTGIVIEPWSSTSTSPQPLAFFGDLIGNVYAVNAVTGKLVWRRRASDHPSLTITAAPVLYAGRLYVALSSLEVTAAADPSYACCTFKGGVVALDAHSGEPQWTGYTITEAQKVVGKNSVGVDRIAPSGSPVWGTPSIDERRALMYVGTGENYSSPADGSSDAIVALSLADGHVVWTQQMTKGDAWNMACEGEDQSNCPPEDGPDFDFGAATILVTTTAGKDVLLAGQKSGEVFALDPEREGKVIWRKKLGRGGIQGGVHFGMTAIGDVLYVPISDFNGGDRWPGEPHPGMYAVDVNTGDLLWSTPASDVCNGRQFCQPGLSAAASSITGAVFSGAMDGHLRAYDSAAGDIIWDYDTAREYRTLSGATGFGGSLGGAAAPVFKDGMMCVNSGYGIYFHMPGNVLLAFTIEDKPK